MFDCLETAVRNPRGHPRDLQLAQAEAPRAAKDERGATETPEVPVFNGLVKTA